MEHYIIDEYSEKTVTNELIDVIEKQMEFINNPLDIEKIRELLKKHLNKKSKLLVLKEVEIVGFAFFNIGFGLETGGEYLWLNELHIIKEHRSKGYGAMIMNHLSGYCEENKIKKILGLVSKNNQAMDYYMKHSFTLKDYYLFDKNI